MDLERLARIGIPFVTRADVAKRYALSGQRAINAIRVLVELGILSPIDVRTRGGAAFAAREVVELVSA